MLSIAKETGWSERFILEELPLARGWQYRMAIMRGYGLACFYTASNEEKKEVRDEFANMLNFDNRGQL